MILWITFPETSILPKVITIYITPATGRIRFIGSREWE